MTMKIHRTDAPATNEVVMVLPANPRRTYARIVNVSLGVMSGAIALAEAIDVSTDQIAGLRFSENIGGEYTVPEGFTGPVFARYTSVAVVGDPACIAVECEAVTKTV